MAKTLFIVKDDVFLGLPEPAQKKLLSEVANLFSFVSQFNVEARDPLQFPPILHFTDSVVSLTESDQALSPVLQHMKQKQTTNVKYSIKQAGVNLTIDTPPPSFEGNLEAGGIGGHWKAVVPIGGKKVSISMMYGVASLESAEDAFQEELLHARKAIDIRAQQREKLRKDANWLKTKEGQQSTRDLAEAELLSRHRPLKDWPSDQWESVATALARIVAHEARHQYVQEHSAQGLGTSSPRIWGDRNFEAFDGRDQANIIARINNLNTSWDTADVHLETCPTQQASPFA